MATSSDLPKFGEGTVKKGKGFCWKSVGIQCSAKKKPQPSEKK